LHAYFEPSFSDHSHGFRPQRGCHTALKDIYDHWAGVTWFVEGDISACFDSLSHDILLDTLAEYIHDGRFLRLIRELLKAGYLEDWQWTRTLSGAPQGSIIGPTLSNIYLSKLDAFVEETLIPTDDSDMVAMQMTGCSVSSGRGQKLRTLKTKLEHS
jgi:retron-type reverse transcriptase